MTKRRTKRDFYLSVKDVLDAHPRARKLHVIFDNLNIHSAKSIEEAFGYNESRKLLSRIIWHCTPKYVSRIDLAEIEINVMDTECTNRRFDSKDDLERNVKAREERRNRQRSKIRWTFTRQKAERNS